MVKSETQDSLKLQKDIDRKEAEQENGVFEISTSQMQYTADN